MSEKNTKQAILKEPRERHYVLGHIAFRQIVENDPHYFFGALSEHTQRQFLHNLIAQVEDNCPDDNTLISADDIEVELSRIANYPLVLIKMPAPKAYVECRYVGVLSMMDMSVPIPKDKPEINYFTLELGEGGDGECNFFCQWIGEQHCNLAEVESRCSLEEFATLISHRIESQLNQSH